MATKRKPEVTAHNCIIPTNQDLYTMRDSIEAFLRSDVQVAFPFSYALSKNLRLIKREITDLEAPVQPGEKFRDFEKRREELAENHSKKDPKTGKPVVINDQYQLNDYNAFDKDFRELKDEFKEILEAQEEKKRQYDEMMKKDATVEFFHIPSKQWPKEAKSRLGFLAPLVADPEEIEKQLVS